MTFSLIGRSKDGTQIGVAVASKFLAVGAYVPAADADAGALATQAYGNVALKTEGLALLKDGLSPEAMLQQFLSTDPMRDERQIGVVDKVGKAITYTGSKCMPWAGGIATEHSDGSYAAQGNMLAGEHVVTAMVDTWIAQANEPILARRLVNALQAGQAAGGDPRGKQAAAVLVVSKGGGYGGLSDVVVDLRSDDSPEPIDELLRMIDLHDLYFGVTPDDQLITVDKALKDEIIRRLAIAGFASDDYWHDLYQWMGRENFEERWHDGKLDPVVLEQLRSMT